MTITKLYETIDGLRLEIEHLRNCIWDGQAGASKLTEENKRLQGQIGERTRNIERLERVADGLNDTIVTLTETHEVNTKTILRLQGLVKLANSRWPETAVAILKGQDADRERQAEEIKRLRGVVRDDQASIGRIQGSLCERNAEIVRLRCQRTMVDEELKRLRVAGTHHVCHGCGADLTRLHQENDQLRSENNS